MKLNLGESAKARAWITIAPITAPITYREYLALNRLLAVTECAVVIDCVVVVTATYSAFASAAAFAAASGSLVNETRTALAFLSSSMTSDTTLYGHR